MRRTMTAKPGAQGADKGALGSVLRAGAKWN